MVSDTKFRRQKGLTMVEMMMTMLIASVLVLGMTGMLVDSLRGWKTMYDRLHSNEADNTYVMRKMFDRAVRQASSAYPVTVATDGTSATVFYYNSQASTYVDRVATFTFSSANKTLTVKTYTVDSSGGYDSTKPTFNQVIPNIVPLTTGKNPFVRSGRSVQMLLAVQNNMNKPTEKFSETLNVLTSAYINSW